MPCISKGYAHDDLLGLLVLVDVEGGVLPFELVDGLLELLVELLLGGFDLQRQHGVRHEHALTTHVETHVT